MAQPGRTIRLTWGNLPFVLVHVIAIAGVALSGWSWAGLGWALALYAARMFFVTAGYHRYFAHRSFKTSRPFQLVLAVAAATSAQRGVIWWAAHHRRHHRFSDQPEDVHSVRQDGFLWSHVGWVMSEEFGATDRRWVPDLLRFPELRWLDRYKHLPPVVLAVVCLAVGGWFGLLWGFFVSTVLLWHGTFTINSLSHLVGRRRYPTRDDSRNQWLLALITFGEGWHNNHHHHQGSVNQGFRWYEVDITYYGLRLLAALGLVWDLRRPPARVLAGASDEAALTPADAAPRLR